MNRKLNVCISYLIAAGMAASLANAARADAYINEIYFDPPSGLESTGEFIELRGTPSMSLAKYYLIFVDAEDNSFHTGNAGKIEQIFNLTSRSFGTNGFLTLRQKSNGYSVASGTTNLVNSGSGTGFGSGSGSSIGASDRNSSIGGVTGTIKIGFTAMLIRNDSGTAPALNFDLDSGNNGLDVATGRAGWTILDSIGFTRQAQAFTGRYYGKINFGFELPDLNPQSITYFDPSQHMAPNATYVGLGYDGQLLDRWGNSTGQTAADWHVPNTTNDPGSGYQSGTTNYRQSGDPHPINDGNINTPPPQPSTIESNRGVPYGTILTNTLGAPNFLLGDYNKDGRVDMADYIVWRKRVGQTGTDLVDNPADGDHDYVVGPGDYSVWRSHFGEPFSSSAPGSGAALNSSMVPEPSGLLLALLASLGAMQLRRRRATRTH